MNSEKILLNEIGQVIYRGTNIEITPDEIHDIKINLGLPTSCILDIRYNEIIQRKRLDSLEILLD
jgi:hypothetical protein